MDINNLFATNIRIGNLDPLDVNAVWPNNIEVTICRVPIRKRDGYSTDKIKKLAEKLKTHTVKNGIVFLLCYAPNECKHRPFEVAKIMSDAGFNEVQEGRRKYWVGYVYSNGSSDGFRNSCGHKREVSLMDAIRVLYPKELEKEEERVETLKKEFLNKNSKELVFDFSDYKITE